ncbi:MAG: RNase P subunit p30 family protein [Promethearchaeota archaeon]
MSYFESRLRVKTNNFKEIEEKLRFCKLLGIQNVIVELENNGEKTRADLKRRIEEITNINVKYRTNINPKNLESLIKKLKGIGQSSNVIVVESADKKIQIQAAKDSRVDVVSFSEQAVLRTIFPGVISLTKQNQSFIEFSLASIMVKNKSLQSKNLRNLYRGVQLANNLNANYIISGNFDDLYAIRHPRALISICHTLLGISVLRAKNSFSKNVVSLLNRVQMRKDKNFIETGVKLISRGEK